MVAASLTTPRSRAFLLLLLGAAWLGLACGGTSGLFSSPVPTASSTAVASPAVEDAATTRPTSATVVAARGGSLSLQDAAMVTIPPNALTADATVTMARRDDSTVAALKGGQALSPTITIDVSPGRLQTGATLTMAFDARALPPATPKSSVFLAYYDAGAHDWIPVAGTLDERGNTITVQTNHFSTWKIWTWNWDAWLAALHGTLSVDVADFLNGASLLTTPCPTAAGTTSVDNTNGSSIIQGCIGGITAAGANVRINNLKEYSIDVSGLPGAGDQILDPGDSRSFTIDTKSPQPLTVTALFTDESMKLFTIDLEFRLLLPLNKALPNDGIKFISKGLDPFWSGFGVGKALKAGDARSAALKLAQALTEDAVIKALVARAVAYGTQHGIEQLSSLTEAGVQKVLLGVKATDVIISAYDFIINYFLNNRTSVTFRWQPGQAIVPSPIATGTRSADPTRTPTPVPQAPTRTPTPAPLIPPQRTATPAPPVFRSPTPSSINVGEGAGYLIARKQQMPATATQPFLSRSISVPYSGGRVVLASTGTGGGNILVDDQVKLTVRGGDGQVREFSDDFSKGCTINLDGGGDQPPQDVTSLFRAGINQVSVEFRDLCGGSQGNTDIYLVVLAGATAPCPVNAPTAVAGGVTISNPVCIRVGAQAMPGPPTPIGTLYGRID